jgi:hypothetical protein
MGAPNSGKSALLAAMTNATPEVASYPFTTQKPDVGMIEFENVQIQLVDTPPLYENFHPPWLLALGRSSNVIIGMISGSKSNPEKELDSLLSRLETGSIFLESRDFYNGEDLMRKNGFIIVSRSSEDKIKLLREKYGERLDFQRFELNSEVEILKKEIYDFLNLIRIYTKPPGKEADFTEPVVLSKGSTVEDAAYHIHKDFANKMKYTKLWRGSNNPRQVGPEEVLMEGDVVEFHSR